MEGHGTTHITAAILCALVAGWATVPAAAGSIEDQVEVALLAVSYQKLEGSEYKIAIVHDDNVPDWSLRKVDRAMKKNRSLSRKGIRLKTARVPMAESQKLKRQLEEFKTNAVFIMAGNTMDNAKKIVELTRKLKMLSIAGEPDHVDQAGATLGIRKTARGYKILINHQGRAQEGVLFDTRLLRMSSH